MKTIAQVMITAFVTLTFCLGSAWAGEVTGLTTFVPDTPAYANEVNDNFNAVKTAVDDNYARIISNDTDIGTNATNIANNTTQINSNTTGINDNATKIADNASQIGINTAGITANGLGISTNAANIANHDTLINNNTTAIQGKQNRVTGQCLAGYSIRSIDADGNVICERDDVTAVGMLGYSQIGSGYINVDSLGVRDVDPDTVLRTVSFVSPADGYVMVTATGRGCIHTDGGYVELFLKKGADYLNYLGFYSVRGVGSACAVGESTQFSWQYIEPVAANSAHRFDVAGHKGSSATLSGNVTITSVAAIFLPGL